MDMRKIVGSNLKEIRAGNNLTQAELGEVIGMNRKTVGYIERGTSSLPLECVHTMIERRLIQSPDRLLLDRQIHLG